MHRVRPRTLHRDQPARRDLRKEMGSFSLSGSAVYSCERLPCTLFQAFAIISPVVEKGVVEEALVATSGTSNTGLQGVT
jgi:hypothetical protein